MEMIGVVLGVLIGANIILSIITKDWCAFCGWLVAGLEWSRRLMVQC